MGSHIRVVGFLGFTTDVVSAVGAVRNTELIDAQVGTNGGECEDDDSDTRAVDSRDVVSTPAMSWRKRGLRGPIVGYQVVSEYTRSAIL